MPFDGATRGTRDWVGTVFRRLVPERIFADLPVHGNSGWSHRTLVRTALLWAWSASPALTDRLAEATAVMAERDPAFRAISFQAFRKRLVRWSERLLDRLLPWLRGRMRPLGNWTIGDWIVFGTDGSRLDLPRTRSHEGHWLPDRRRRGGRSRRRGNRGTRNSDAHLEQERPQVFLTLLWHVGLRLPWAWRIGPLNSSERHEFRELLPTLPENALVAADAGFTGYELWRALADAGHDFVIRVGSNLRLLRKLAHVRQRNDRVHLWPDAARRRGEPPIELRLLEFRTERSTVYVVTSVLDRERLPGAEAVAIYRARWGIEVWLRGFKQTFGRTKLRSAAAHNVPHEVDWSIAALGIAQLWAAERLDRHGVPPDRISTANLLRTLRRTTFGPARPVAVDHRRGLEWSVLKDDYDRKAPKTRRRAPRRKRETAPGPPNLVDANATQRHAARQFLTRAA
jgi:hypothetical protein